MIIKSNKPCPTIQDKIGPFPHRCGNMAFYKGLFSLNSLQAIRYPGAMLV
jgi:hypothetical protein